MIEREFEDIICKYPELIEEGLIFKGRQVSVKGKFVDVLFKDRHGHTLIVELKKGVIKRQHIAQLLDYEGYFLSADNPAVRVMLVGNRVPNNLRRALDHHGFEWKDIPVSHLVNFLKEKEDKELLGYFIMEELEIESKPTKKRTVRKPIASRRKRLPSLQSAGTFEELEEILRIRYPTYPTNYMDLLLIENKNKSLSQILAEFQEYAKTLGYKAFDSVSYLRSHIQYRERARGWVFDYSGEPKDPIVRLVDLKSDKDLKEKSRQVPERPNNRNIKPGILLPSEFLKSSYFQNLTLTSISLIKHLMKKADSLGIKYVMKIRADGAVALSHFEKNGQNFVKIWPRQDWIVAIVIGHTEREPYRAEKEIDKNLVPLIERKYEEICKVVGN